MTGEFQVVKLSAGAYLLTIEDKPMGVYPSYIEALNHWIDIVR